MRRTCQEQMLTTLSGTRLEDTWVSNTGTFYAASPSSSTRTPSILAAGHGSSSTRPLRAAIVVRADNSFGDFSTPRPSAVAAARRPRDQTGRVAALCSTRAGADDDVGARRGLRPRRVHGEGPARADGARLLRGRQVPRGHRRLRADVRREAARELHLQHRARCYQTCPIPTRRSPASATTCALAQGSAAEKARRSAAIIREMEALRAARATAAPTSEELVPNEETTSLPLAVAAPYPVRVVAHRPARGIARGRARPPIAAKEHPTTEKREASSTHRGAAHRGAVAAPGPARRRRARLAKVEAMLGKAKAEDRLAEQALSSARSTPQRRLQSRLKAHRRAQARHGQRRPGWPPRRRREITRRRPRCATPSCKAMHGLRCRYGEHRDLARTEQAHWPSSSCGPSTTGIEGRASSVLSRSPVRVPSGFGKQVAAGAAPKAP